MKLKVILPIVASFAIIVVLVGVAGLWGENSDKSIDTKGVATINNPVISPSGKCQLKVTEVTLEGVKHNKFSIFKVSDGKIESTALYISKDAYRTRDTLYFIWDDKDRVWVYSGDVGTFFWEQVTDDKWEKRTYTDNISVPVPSLLKQLKPEDFKN